MLVFHHFIAMALISWLFLMQLPLVASFIRIPHLHQPLRPLTAFIHDHSFRRPTQLHGWFTTKDESTVSSSVTNKVPRRPTSFPIREIGSVIGSGSYGTVHYISVDEDGAAVQLIGKRPWTVQELQEKYQSIADNVVSKDESDNIKDKAMRCQYYFTVEKHCFTKMIQEDAISFGIPQYRGIGVDSERREWMLFDPIYAPNAVGPTEIATSLQELIELDRMRTEQLNDEEKVLEDRQFDHHLYYTSQALLGSHADHSLVATLDALMEQLLQILQNIHSYSIVHRDVKPANLLISESGQLVLIDFGSAGDLSTAGLLNQNIGLDMNRVAISPIYAAPEVFLDSGSGSKYAANFDCFSVALLFCQMMFQYVDERTESGFHQQLANQNVPWDLDSWLQSALQSKVRPSGLGNALEVLKDRPGLWKLLQDMLLPSPSDRLSSTEALQRWNKIVKNAKSLQSIESSSTLTETEQKDPDLYDGAYLLDVLESLEACEIPTIRPLHFVTSFDRSSSLGLYLSEVDSVNIDEMDSISREQWLYATSDAVPGEVFIQEVIPGGQADKIGVFAVGDRLQGVGELPVAGGGFLRATELIQDQPKSAEFITLHFDRKSAVVPLANGKEPSTPLKATAPIIAGGNTSTGIQLVDQGAWSIKGRRQAQEDAFILHEVLSSKDRSVILAGVFDGHLGSAAADFCRDDLPVAFAAAMNVGINGDPKPMERDDFSGESSVQSNLQLAWNQCCDSYRSSCQSIETECVAEYDPKEGILMANTGSQTAVAGTTAMVFALDQTTNQLAALNCGDSRGIVLDGAGQLLFQSVDHKPESEIERLTELGNPPRCAVARWTIEVGQYDYAVARSLEGPLATSRGIVSDADVTLFPAQAGMTVVVATDGVWDVMDTAEVQQVVNKWRMSRSASDIARALCSLAYEKGSSDNMSVVVLCLE